MFTGRHDKNTVKYSELDKSRLFGLSMSAEKPIPPANSECCESGCSRCVWDTYYEEMQVWNAEQQAAKAAEKQTAETKES